MFIRCAWRWRCMHTYTTKFRKNQNISKYEMERRRRYKKDEESTKLLHFSFLRKKVGWLMNFTLLTPCFVIQIV